ncbi:MAG TPA: hypothetical protein VFO38_03240 [Candidatus Saccharimonadales bacterium]|nr:hypothetical protein [Candidatus Saccharimonadales bacterium]
MIGLNHVLTGCAIAIAVKQPLLVAPSALLSHFLLDAIPHFDHTHYRHGSKYFFKIMTADTILSVAATILVMWAIPQYAAVIALGAFFAILPDILWVYYYTHNRPAWWFFRFHSKIQWFERPEGAIVEVSYTFFIALVTIALQ